MYSNELQGGRKPIESLSNLLRSASVLLHSFGSVHMHVGDPISLKRLMQDPRSYQPYECPKFQSMRGSAFWVQEHLLGHRIRVWRYWTILVLVVVVVVVVQRSNPRKFGSLRGRNRHHEQQCEVVWQIFFGGGGGRGSAMAKEGVVSGWLGQTGAVVGNHGGKWGHKGKWEDAWVRSKGVVECYKNGSMGFLRAGVWAMSWWETKHS